MPLVQQMGLQIRFNTKTKCVELRAGPATRDAGALQKGEDYVRAFILGFELKVTSST
jgi:RNA-binding protein PNO1